MRIFAIGAAAVTFIASSASAAPPAKRHHFEAYGGLGVGNAFCGDNAPESDCPVDRGVGGAFAAGFGFRFHPKVSIGLELGAWGFRTRDSWRGKLQDPASDVRFSAAYISPVVRYFFVSRGSADAYLQFGLGFGRIGADAENGGNKYNLTFNGISTHAAIGVEWYVARFLRLGPQGMLYLHSSTRTCETINGGEVCRDASRDEGMLAWRILIVQASFVFG
jgi:hypothetical protein